MNSNFIPDYELIVGRPSRLNNLVIPFSLVNPEKLDKGVNGVDSSGTRFSLSPEGFTLDNGDYYDYNTIPAQYFSIKNLQVVADIPQTKEQGTKVKFVVTNLSDDIEEFIKVDDNIIFRAAYRSSLASPTQELPDLFIGQVQRVFSEENDTDKKTTIECSEAQTLRRNSRVTYSWPPNTTRQSVIQTLLGFLGKQGVPTGKFVLPPVESEEYEILNKPFLSGYSCKGYTFEEIKRVCDACYLYCYLALGKIYIEPKTITGNIPLQTRNKRSFEVFTITPSQVKGQLQKVDGASDKTPSNANGGKDLSELSLTTFLDGRLAITKIVKLQDFEKYNGDYRITSIRHSYNHRLAGCYTKLTLKAIHN